MILHIKFSTINIVILSELCFIVKPLRQDFSYIIKKVKHYTYDYIKNPEISKFTSGVLGPHVVENLTSKPPGETYFKYLFFGHILKRVVPIGTT